jgi:hypothetical protein
MDNRKDSKSVTKKDLYKELMDLFEVSPPNQIKASLLEIFFSYLCNTKHSDLNPELPEIATDFYFLIKFLEEAEKNQPVK